MTKINVQIYFNIHPSHFQGYKPGNPLMKVFEYQIIPNGRRTEMIAEQAFWITNGEAANETERQLGKAYHAHPLRPVTIGDVVIVGDAPLACAWSGWAVAEHITIATDDQAQHARESTNYTLTPRLITSNTTNQTRTTSPADPSGTGEQT